MYVATGIMNSCVYYVSALFSMEYINAVIMGNNSAGIFTSVASILSKVTSPDIRIAAIYYFLAALIVLVLALIGYFLMHRNEFYRQMDRNDRIKALVENSVEDTRKAPYSLIIKEVLNFISIELELLIIKVIFFKHSKLFIITVLLDMDLLVLHMAKLF